MAFLWFSYGFPYATGQAAPITDRDSTGAQVSDLLAELPSDLPKGLSLVLAARQGQQHLVEALLSSGVEARSWMAFVCFNGDFWLKFFMDMFFFM